MKLMTHYHCTKCKTKNTIKSQKEFKLFIQPTDDTHVSRCHLTDRSRLDTDSSPSPSQGQRRSPQGQEVVLYLKRTHNLM